MELEHEFTVPLDVAQAWVLLRDARQVAYHLPGACLTEARDEEVTGTLDIALGPARMTYVGEARLVARNDAVHRLVVRAHGRDTGGHSTATAMMTITLTPDVATLRAGPRTVVHVLTDLTITGPPARIGRAILQDAGTWLVTQFATNLAGQVRRLPASIDQTPPTSTAGRSKTGPARRTPPVPAPLKTAPLRTAPPMTAPPMTAPPMTAPPMTAPPITGPLMTALVRYGPWILVTVAGLLLVRRPARSTTAARTWPTVPALPRGLGSVPARLRTTLASRGSRRGTRIWKL